MLLEFADFSAVKKGEIYHTLYMHIKGAVEDKIIKKGEKLPSVREAAAQLGVSRTTVESAYTRLCIEGICESIPQKGYFIRGIPESRTVKIQPASREEVQIKYDFSSRKIDEKAADADLWKKLIRSVLRDSGELISYGDSQGEPGLRGALAEYAYKARGVVTSPDNIVVGAGVGPLLNILCGLMGRDVSVGFENGGFFEAERIFADYGIKTCRLSSDANGADVSALEKSGADVLFLLPSALSRISPAALAARRRAFCEWAQAEKQRMIIEDDYNGELRYTARSIPAFQQKSPGNTVYIGSFSKLLLPSVRIAYMVLPEELKGRFTGLSGCYNQTCGKIEQLALERYISTGAMEKHLKKLRRLYYLKSRLLSRELENKLKCYESLVLYESSLTLELKTSVNLSGAELCREAAKGGVMLMESPCRKSVRLCFAGIPEEDIPDSVTQLDKIFGNL